MSEFFFSGSSVAKVDEKNRFVLPQHLRYGLIENGQLEFTLALGLGGCLTIYRKSDIDKIVERFRKKQHDAKLQKFFTIFFSTLHTTTCDKVGRLLIPSILKGAVGIEGEVVIAGVLNKIEIWPKVKYESELDAFLGGKDPQKLLTTLLDEAFSLLDEKEDEPQEEPINL